MMESITVVDLLSSMPDIRTLVTIFFSIVFENTCKYFEGVFAIAMLEFTTPSLYLVDFKSFCTRLSSFFAKHGGASLISHCIIFETNIFIEMVICVVDDSKSCKSDSRQGKV